MNPKIIGVILIFVSIVSLILVIRSGVFDIRIKRIPTLGPVSLSR